MSGKKLTLLARWICSHFYLWYCGCKSSAKVFLRQEWQVSDPSSWANLPLSYLSRLHSSYWAKLYLYGPSSASRYLAFPHSVHQTTDEWKILVVRLKVDRTGEVGAIAKHWAPTRFQHRSWNSQLRHFLFLAILNLFCRSTFASSGCRCLRTGTPIQTHDFKLYLCLFSI